MGFGSAERSAMNRQYISLLKANQIALEKENVVLKGILAKSSLPCIYCGLVAGSTSCTGWPMGCERMHDVLAVTEQGEI